MKKHTELQESGQLKTDGPPPREAKIAEMSARIAGMTTVQIAERLVKQEALIAHYEEQFRLSQHRRFGASSEKTDYDGHEQQSLFNEAEVTADPTAAEPELEEITYKRRKKHGKDERLPADVPVEIIEYNLSDEEKICPECGEDMPRIGVETRDELVIIPATVTIRRHVKEVCACRKCRDNQEVSTPVVKAAAPPPVISGSFASPEAVAHIMCQKFVMAVPLYRQEFEWRRNDVHLSRQTMSNWLIKCAEDWLEPIYKELKRRLIARDVAHCDESVLQVLREPGKSAQSNSYMWLYRTGSDAETAVVLFEYAPGRGHEYPMAFLSGFKGFLHTDGYEAYRKLPDVTVVGCLAHARRKWDEALKAIPKEARIGTSAFAGLEYCNKLFRLERQFAKLSPDERLQKRQELARPVLDAFYNWLQNLNAAPQSLLGKAESYTLSQWPYIEHYLLDGRLEISNNRAERSMKMFAINRKNFLFAVSQAGAKSSAIIFSLIRTAIENNLKPFEYLAYIFRNAPALDIRNNPDDLAKLMPDSTSLPDNIRFVGQESRAGEQRHVWDVVQ